MALRSRGCGRWGAGQEAVATVWLQCRSYAGRLHARCSRTQMPLAQGRMATHSACTSADSKATAPLHLQSRHSQTALDITCRCANAVSTDTVHDNGVHSLSDIHTASAELEDTATYISWWRRDRGDARLLWRQALGDSVQFLLAVLVLQQSLVNELLVRSEADTAQVHTQSREQQSKRRRQVSTTTMSRTASALLRARGVAGCALLSLVVVSSLSAAALQLLRLRPAQMPGRRCRQESASTQCALLPCRWSLRIG